MQAFMFGTHQRLGQESPVRMLDQYLIAQIMGGIDDNLYISMSYSLIQPSWGMDHIEIDNVSFSFSKSIFIDSIHIVKQKCVTAAPGLTLYAYCVDDKVMDDEVNLKVALNSALDQTNDIITYYKEDVRTGRNSHKQTYKTIQRIPLRMIEYPTEFYAVYETATCPDTEVLLGGLFQLKEDAIQLYEEGYDEYTDVKVVKVPLVE